MPSIFHLWPAALACTMLVAIADQAPAQSFSPAQRSEIEAIIKDYLIKNPETLQEAIAELEKRQTLGKLKDQAVIKDIATLFSSPRQVKRQSQRRVTWWSSRYN